MAETPDDSNEMSAAERAQAFERAKRLVVKINEVLDGSEDEDVFLTLQLLQAKFLVRTGMDLRVFLGVMANNLPNLQIMWEKATIDAEAGSAKLFSPAGSRIDTGRPGGRGSA